MALTKVSGGILDPGINVAGIVTATGFDGPFIGGSGKNIVAGIVTCTELDLNGSGNISGNLVVEGNLTANGDFTTLNTTLREVELLRVDAQDNSVAAGIITQRGTGNILELYDTSTNVLTVKDGGKIGIGTDTPSHLLHLQSASSPSIKLEDTTNTCILLSYAQNTNAHVGTYSDHDLIFDTDSTEKVRITSSGQVAIGTVTAETNFLTTINGDLSLGEKNGADNTYIDQKQNGDLHIINSGRTSNGGSGTPGTAGVGINRYNTIAGDTTYFRDFTVYDGKNSKVLCVDGSVGMVGIGTDAPTGLLDIKSDSGTYDHLRLRRLGSGAGDSDWSVKPYGGHLWFRTGGATDRVGFSSVGQIIAGAGSIEAGSSTKLCVVGSGSPAVHPSSIAASTLATFRMTGGLGHAAGISIIGGSTGSSVLNFGDRDNETIGRILYNHTSGNSDDYMDFYVQGDDKLRITSGGNLKLPDNAKIELGGAQTGAGDLEIYYDGTDGFINQKNNALKIQHNGTLKSYFGSNTFNLQDDYKLGLGDVNDLQIYHTTSGTSWIRHTNSSEYFILEGNQIDFRDYATGVYRARMGTAVQLYYNGNNVKLATTNTGITVTGEVAASQDYPNFRPTLDFNFASEKKLDPRITYSRTGPASFTNEFGKVILVGDNVPRFDHDPDTRECKGLLIEESRTNISPYSNDLSGFSGVNITKTANDAVAPDGTTTATKLEHGGGGATWYLDYLDNSINAQNAGIYTYSVWVKAPDDQPDDYYGCRLSLLHSTGGNVEVNFGLSRNWRRISVTKTYGASDSGKLRVHPIIFRASPGSTSGGYVMPSYVWVWGAQLEQGAFPTSYIPVAGATRGADLVEITEEEFSEFYNPIESTILVDYTHDITNSQLGSDQRVYRFRAVGGSDTRIDYVSNSGYNPYIAKDGSAVASISHGQAHVFNGGVNRSAVRVKENSFAVSYNGSTIVEDTSGAWDPTNTITELSLGSSSGGSALNGHIQRFMYYSTGLPNSQLVTLTS